MVELVYKLDEKSKGESTTKVPFKLLGGSHIYIIHTHKRTTHNDTGIGVVWRNPNFVKLLPSLVHWKNPPPPTVIGKRIF